MSARQLALIVFRIPIRPAVTSPPALRSNGSGKTPCPVQRIGRPREIFIDATMGGSDMSRKISAIAFPVIALTLTVCVAAGSASRAAAAGPETDKPQFNHTRFERESRRFEPRYGYRPIETAPPTYPYTRIEKRTVLVPEWVTEHKQVPTTEIRHEVRDKEIVCYKDVPETVQHTRTVTYTERQVRSHEEKYTVQKQVTEKVEQKYTVPVPYTETRNATRTIFKPIWKEIEHKYTIYVPYYEKRTAYRPVSRCVPVVRTRDVCVDQGYWEERISKPVYKFCGPGTPPVPVPVCKTRVWVPKLVHKQVPYTVNTYETVQVPYEYQVKLERPEVRTKIEKIREMIPTQQPYSYNVYLTRYETRSRYVDVYRYVPEVKSRTVYETVYVPRQKTVPYYETVYRRVAEKRIVKERFDVPVYSYRDVEVRVSHLVPKTVEVQVAVKPVYGPPGGGK
jgi:YTV protein